MSTAPVVVVAGVPELVVPMQRAGVFASVWPASTVSEVLDLIKGDLKGARPGSLLFVFSDNLRQGNTGFTVDDFVGRVSGAGYQVVLVGVTGAAKDIQRRNPKAALLPLPVTLNNVLGAVAALGYPHVSPVADGNIDLQIGGGSAPTSTPATPAAPAASGWKLPDTGWQTPGTDMAPAAPAPAATPAAFTTPVAPVTPEPASRPTLADFTQDTPPVGAGWAPTRPAERTPEPASPSWNAGTPAASPTPTSGWGTPPADPYNAAPSAFPATSATGYGVSPRAVNSMNQGGRRGFVITVAASKGGTGKSSVTLNLGAFLGMRLRAQRKTVCVIDANVQQADAGKYLNTYVPNITDIARDRSMLSDENPQRLLRSLVHKPEYNLSVLLGPATPDEGNPMAINAELYNAIIDRLKPHYDYILIDTPVAEKFHSLFTKFALPRADFIVVPVAPNLATLQNADNWLQAAVVAPPNLGGAGIDPSKIGIVLNRAEEGIGLTQYDAQAEMGRWQFLGAIPETKEWKAANNRNELVAPKNYVELSQAFAQILYQATGEPVLLENFAVADTEERTGILGRILKKRGR